MDFSSFDTAGQSIDVILLQVHEQGGDRDRDQHCSGRKTRIPVIDVFLLQHFSRLFISFSGNTLVIIHKPCIGRKRNTIEKPVQRDGILKSFTGIFPDLLLVLSAKLGNRLRVCQSSDIINHPEKYTGIRVYFSG